MEHFFPHPPHKKEAKKEKTLDKIGEAIQSTSNEEQIEVVWMKKKKKKIWKNNRKKYWRKKTFILNILKNLYPCMYDGGVGVKTKKDTATLTNEIEWDGKEKANHDRDDCVLLLSFLVLFFIICTT